MDSKGNGNKPQMSTHAQPWCWLTAVTLLPLRKKTLFWASATSTRRWQHHTRLGPVSCDDSGIICNNISFLVVSELWIQEMPQRDVAAALWQGAEMTALVSASVLKTIFLIFRSPWRNLHVLQMRNNWEFISWPQAHDMDGTVKRNTT